MKEEINKAIKEHNRTHATTIQGMNMKELAKAVSELRYDAMQDFFHSLHKELSKDVVEDADRGRHLLSSYLSNTAGHCEQAAFRTGQAWEVARKFEPEK